ncbi:hypothetical protein [Cohnella thailandensis]|uniref:Uncharacterized protein n=1 Tax=Cohnella thailandensis TaxID=557557 RepID=A0A841T063_9BACL|nr:hypothetical protein [Cohnella thailandensis]MBB6637534.1 hypothetical protein [Cohnella thailandensis]MBP1977567.1 hypothetical protein [Cohnella thailandensis]
MTMESNHSPINRILRELEKEDTVNRLAERLSGADFNSLMLEIFKARTRLSTPSELLKKYESNRFVHPADIDPLQLKKLELDLLTIAKKHLVTPLQLSPVAPLGSCSVVGPVDQNKVISASRGTEVVADATNLLALHICRLLKSREQSDREEFIRFSTTHRHVRAQYFGDSPGMLSHFHIFCMATAGADNGSYSFEIPSFWEHILVYQDIFETLFGSGIEVRLSGRGGYKDHEGLLKRIVEEGERRSIKVATTRIEPNFENEYYQGLQFTIATNIRGRVYDIGDGGYVDWSQRLLGNKKQRMLISAIGLDRLLL